MSLHDWWMCSPLHRAMSSKFVSKKDFPFMESPCEKDIFNEITHKICHLLSWRMGFIPDNDAKIVTSQIVHNDKIPNMQGII
jgi:hypothetical protein